MCPAFAFLPPHVSTQHLPAATPPANLQMPGMGPLPAAAAAPSDAPANSLVGGPIGDLLEANYVILNEVWACCVLYHDVPLALPLAVPLWRGLPCWHWSPPVWSLTSTCCRTLRLRKQRKRSRPLLASISCFYCPAGHLPAHLPSLKPLPSVPCQHGGVQGAGKHRAAGCLQGQRAGNHQCNGGHGGGDGADAAAAGQVREAEGG